MVANYEQCRYLRRDGERCTAEVAAPDADILLCGKHLLRAHHALNNAMLGRPQKHADTA